MDDSDEATFTYTVRKEDGEDKLGKLTSADQLTDGSYVMIVSTGYAPLELSGKWLTVVQPTVAEDKVTKTEGAVWTLKVSGQSVTLTDKNGMAIAPSGGNSNDIQSGNYSWAWSFSAENQTFKFMGAGDDTVTLASNTSTDSTYGGFNKFKAYKNNTVASQQYPCEFTLYRVDPASADQPSGDLPKPGDKFVIYNQNAQAVLAAENDSNTSASRAKPMATSAPTAPATTRSTARTSPKRALRLTTPTGSSANAPAAWAAMSWRAARRSSTIGIASGWSTTPIRSRPTAWIRARSRITPSTPSSSIPWRTA